MHQDTNPSLSMRAVLCCTVILMGILPIVSAQEKAAPNGNAFFSKDSIKTKASSSTAPQTHFVEYNRDRITARSTDNNNPGSESQSVDPPIRDWSNPPGFLGYSSNANLKSAKHKQKMKKHKDHPHHKYHYKEKGRCPRF